MNAIFIFIFTIIYITIIKDIIINVYYYFNLTHDAILFINFGYEVFILIILSIII
jgi:hypothetical protein